MSQNQLDTDVVKSFWTERANFSSNRWTSGDLVKYENELLLPLTKTAKRIADIGSGTGDLSRELAGTEKELVAVDFVGKFGSVFDQENHTFIEAPATNLPPDLGKFEVVLLMGVITYLDDSEENNAYAECARLLADNGTLFLKHQCSSSDEFIVNGWSDDLGAAYSARYPSFEAELEKLQQLFGAIEVVKYPEQFNKWDTSFHVAFICSDPK